MLFQESVNRVANQTGSMSGTRNRFRLNCGLRFALVAFALTLGATQALGQATLQGLVAMQVLGQCPELQKLTAPIPSSPDWYGNSVAIDGDTAMVGAFLDRCVDGTFGCGAVHVYGFNGTSWVHEQKLTASDATGFDQFGSGVSISGDTAVIGARDADCVGGAKCGAAYVFRFDGTSWVEEQKLFASDAAAHDDFGHNLSLSGDTVLISAPRRDCDGDLNSDCGAKYFFQFNGTSWVEIKKILNFGGGSFSGGGSSISGDTAAFGTGLGVFVYRFNGTSWEEEQELAFPRGASVSVHQDTLAVGIREDCAAGLLSCGVVHVFRYVGTSWVEETVLTISDSSESAFFLNVSLSADPVNGYMIAVGAFRVDCAAGADCGAAYIFSFNGTRWVERHKLTASDEGVDDEFGAAVSISGGTVFVGASFNDCADGADCGAAYVFNCDLSCGNGSIDLGETCDDGFSDACGACNADCTGIGTGATCGDASLCPETEECDDGASNSNTAPDACRSDCTNPSCGDNVIDAGEECDDAASNSDTTPDACRTDCTDASCGDGIVDAGEDCDDAGESPTCDIDCTISECGDGTINASAGEECDDAGETPECKIDCTIQFDPPQFRGLGGIRAFGISADGSVAVGNKATSLGPSNNEAFRWTVAGGIVGLGDLTDGSFASAANAISADSLVIVGSGNSASGNEAFRWDKTSGMVGLGDLPGGIFISFASATSEDGSVVVGLSSSASGNEAFRWTADGGMVGLGDLPGGTFSSRAFGISADGSVVVGDSLSASGSEAFRWTQAGGMIGLGDLPGGTFSSGARGISADGAVVVGSSRSALTGSDEAFRWTADGGMVGLGVIAGTGFSQAFATSANGAVIVGRSGQTNAFIWTANEGMRSLQDVLVSDFGLDLTGWRLDTALGISADGLTIVGAGSDPARFTEAWIAKLPPPVCGDSIIEIGEECDDGNTDDGDGCSATCTVEPASTCTGEPSVCITGIPAVSDWGLIAMALLVLTAGTLVCRRRRPAQE